MPSKAAFQYDVEVYRRKGGLWETRVRLAHGKRKVIFNSAGQGYERAATALRIAKNLFGTGYGFRFLMQQKDGAFKPVNPW